MLSRASHDSIHEARLGVNKIEAVNNFSALNRFAPKCRLFYSEKLVNSSDMMKEKGHHVLDADFFNSLSAIMFSCMMRMEFFRFSIKETTTKMLLTSL
jgi:hypothetical protein